MNKIKTLIFVILAIIIIIIISLIFLAKQRKTQGSDYQDTDFEHDVSNVEINQSVEQVTNRNDYYAVKNIIGKYAYAIVDGGTESVYSMINTDYLDKNRITVNNIIEVIDNVIGSDLSEEQMNDLKLNILIDKMYCKESAVNIRTFFVYGNFSNNVEQNKVAFQIIVEIDSKNNTFYIYPTSYVIQNYQDEKDLESYTTKLTEIPKNDYNTFTFVNVEDTTVINDYLSNFKSLLINDIDSSYELLDQDYKTAKFENIDAYKEYVNNNINYLLTITIDKYKKDVTENGTQYTCIDKNGNYYIFEETTVMKYKVLLDTYTVILPEFAEQYDSLENTKKVAMNIEKIIQALNLRDFKYIYNKLDDTFKANNFSTLEDFEKYMDENYPSIYNVEYTTYNQENETYMQTIILNDKNSDEQKENTIIMQLKDNYEFVMSFSVQE